MGRVIGFPRSTRNTYIRSAFWCESGTFRGRDATRSGLTSMEQFDVLFHEVTPPTRGCYPGLPSKAPNNFK